MLNAAFPANTLCHAAAGVAGQGMAGITTIITTHTTRLVRPVVFA